ncbi:aldehyde dehydrogenase [Paenibacillus sp. 1001270B_150601_E10]|uniref:aldehyde dehydrogenase n=1 Tax=Paenibacillus sp. 1001270B_150601_E10 TaxID=2787079 RepID=UPI00189CBC90|nr:aldehyde dehydrogenase [Paenibacillus sp. 1001270B_150601_E10]
MNRTDIEQIVHTQKQFYLQGRTRGVEARIHALHKLIQAIEHYEQEITYALKQDLDKSDTESYITEIGFTLMEARHTLKSLRRWMKPKRVRTPITHVGSRSVIMPEPYGTTLIIAPWNYPFQLAVAPLIGAIAAGNTAVIKPSEWAPHTSAMLVKLIRHAFEPEQVTVVEGAVEESEWLLQMPFDYIFFTGSTSIGKIVMKAAAERLIPVTLELGGKSPCIVHQDADLELAAKRTAFGKWTNAGQTCIAPDYLVVHESVKDALLQEMKKAVEQFYGELPLDSTNYPSIISDKHYQRLAGFLKDGKIAWGGQYDEARRRIAPTVLTNISWEHGIMQEEIFGPLLPVMTYSSIDDVVQAVQARSKPLALYLFTKDRKLQDNVLSKLSFGGGCVNDTLMHIASPYLPFGGVGDSGIGSYHGKASFDTFSHQKSVLFQTNRFDLSLRYPGVKNALKWMKKIMK